MQVEYNKEDHEPSYDNLTSPVKENKKTPKAYDITQVLTRPVFKWTALVVAVTTLIIVIVVPTVLEVTKQESINCNWGNWTSFSDCTHSCGGGTQYRIRNCDEPRPAFGGPCCVGNDTDVQSCNTEFCPVHGNWGNWTSVTECSQSCGGGTQTRRRECDNPSPAYDGTLCSGNEEESQSCNTDVCPVHGSWGSWTDVSGCSHSCGGGTHYRIRMCNNPSPSFGGRWCSGNATKFQHCNTQTCPDCRSAFTVYDPRNGPTSGTIKFDDVVTNTGGHFKTQTGQFACEYAGIYVFNINVYTGTCHGVANCHIRKNGNNIIRAYSGPQHTCHAHGSSNSVVLRLVRGDIVDLGGCSKANSLWQWTSFSGFLLQAD